MRGHKQGLVTEFLESEQTSGVVLMLTTVLALGWANSSMGPAFLEFWQQKIGFVGLGLELKQSLEHWINDGLMAIFFLLIGLEIEREFYIGKLANWKEASLPGFAALGGMAVPALCHFLLNQGSATQAGIGIPMATDIAFALGVLALLGDRVPPSLKIFLAAFAIIDDLGAIVLIALFYSKGFSLPAFALAFIIFLGLLLLNRTGVKKLSIYLTAGVVMWYCLLQSGVHATLAGVLLAFAIPFDNGEENSPSTRLLHVLHKPVSYLIMPIFALANTGVVFSGEALAGLATANSGGIFLGLLVGKPLGIVLCAFAAVKTGLAQLPRAAHWRHIIGVGLLGGIGFTMSIFITLLAFQDPLIVEQTKMTVLLSSLSAGLAGFCLLYRGGGTHQI
ncbi:MAG: Na+/H+ antiporter NhaA [Desulfobulbus sp.]|nr:Na+/H+ antiporter NhaA [Desulfobulbus sp.]